MCFGDNGGGDSAEFDPWNAPVGALVEGVTLSDGWTDSVAVSADGKRFYFGYGRWDFPEFYNSDSTVFNPTGPARPGMTGDHFKMFTADLSAGSYINVRPVAVPTFVPSFTGKTVIIGEANVAEVPQGRLMYMMCGIAQSQEEISPGVPENGRPFLDAMPR